MRKILLSVLLICCMGVTLPSCSKDEDSGEKNVCIECSASFNGMTTTPAQFCGPENEAKLFEQHYRDINKNVSVNCKRK